MTTRDLEAASAPAFEEDFFESAPEFEENIPFDLRPIDPLLERKMTPDVRVRRGRLARVVVGVVGCSVLLLVAALAHVRFESAARDAGSGSVVSRSVPLEPRPN